MVVAALLVLLFGLDMATGFPFGRTLQLDAAFVVLAAVLAYLSWATFREQV